MDKFKGTSIEEFRKWMADNWEEIEMAFEKALEEYNKETEKNDFVPEQQMKIMRRERLSSI